MLKYINVGFLVKDIDIFNEYKEKNRVKDFCFDGIKNWKFFFFGFDVFKESF